jgi:hypothetical protein
METAAFIVRMAMLSARRFKRAVRAVLDDIEWLQLT